MAKGRRRAFYGGIRQSANHQTNGCRSSASDSLHRLALPKGVHMKKCKFCLSEIDEGATRCGFCTSWQENHLVPSAEFKFEGAPDMLPWKFLRETKQMQKEYFELITRFMSAYLFMLGALVLIAVLGLLL
jgi:hypothetical protein